MTTTKILWVSPGSDDDDDGSDGMIKRRDHGRQTRKILNF